MKGDAITCEQAMDLEVKIGQMLGKIGFQEANTGWQVKQTAEH